MVFPIEIKKNYNLLIMKENIISHTYQVSKKERNSSNNHNSFLLWFTGLSGSGKSTIANLVENALFDLGIKTYVLDGDNIRKGINNDLSFSPEDRTENIRRIAEVSNLMVDSGLVVLAAFVSPYKKDRENIRTIVKDVNFVEVYINTSIEECERRDVKGLYKKARAGEIKNMTGISAPYEAPKAPDIEIKTEGEPIEVSVQRILDFITPKLQLKDE
ncbi:MAG: adenylylsulfate kinase [Psychroserpens sp.]|jgi:adenylylsulfate kinase